MELTKEQKEALKGVKKHPGYKVLELIANDIANNLGQRLLTVNLQDEKTIKILEDNQIYVRAMQDFLKETEKYIQEVYTPDI